MKSNNDKKIVIVYGFEADEKINTEYYECKSVDNKKNIYCCGVVVDRNIVSILDKIKKFKLYNFVTMRGIEQFSKLYGKKAKWQVAIYKCRKIIL